MSNWQPSCDADVAARRAKLLTRARDYFEQRNILGVDTPALGAATATDPHIESVQSADGRYLQTSPEFFMKRLLAAGYPDIYSICRVFRAGESGRCHLPEFTMIEWYRRATSLSGIIEDAIALISTVLEQPDLPGNLIRMDYKDMFIEAIGLDPIRASIDDLGTAAAADDRLRNELGNRRDSWLDLLLATRIAPSFRHGRLTVVQHYPASQAALARLCPEDPQVADRFEIFYGDLELANGYVELDDATEQAERMTADSQMRRSLGKTPVAPDQRLLSALDAGIGDCAGVAVGLERLHMIAEHADDIRKVVTFSEDS